MGVIILTYSIQRPRMSYLLYGAYTFYLTAIMRYSRQDGLSVISDGLLIYMTISILFYYVKTKMTFVFLMLLIFSLLLI